MIARSFLLLLVLSALCCNGFFVTSNLNINSKVARNAPSEGASMEDYDGWTRNSWGAQCYFQARLAMTDQATPAVASAVIKVDPAKQRWYFNGGLFGVQWINATSAFTVQQTPTGPVCWEIQGWNFTQQVHGYRLMHKYADEGATARFTGPSHDVTSCGCDAHNTMEFLVVGQEYRLLKWGQSQRYALPPGLGAKGVSITFTCPPSGASGSGPTDADMVLPEICQPGNVHPSYCAVFGTTPDCSMLDG